MTAALRLAAYSAWVNFQEVAVNGFLLFAAVWQPFFIGVTTMYMLRHRADFDPMYVIVGTALSGIWSTLLFAGSGAISHERWMGTLELLAASPASFFVVIGGKLAGTTIFSLLSLVLAYGIGALLFGYPIAIAEPGWFALSLLLAVVALWATGMFFAPLAILWRAVGRFLLGLEYPIFALSGFLFPVLLLPVWVLPISNVLPPYWAAVAMHGAASGDLDLTDLLRAWFFLLVTGGALLLIARWLFEQVLTRARRAGTLALS
ncbi:MAG TPA: ABC transporter permease [Candidatus Limnocylindria bacterium]|nr:ABC transporter permease [Candidatus Limnocylindria bacterium]